MKRKILTILTIGSIFCMALTGCGDSSYRNSAKSETSTLSDVTTESDITTTAAEHPDVSELESIKEADEEIEQEIEEAEGEETEIENPVFGEAGLYRSDGSFIPWDDLGIDVETDYTGQNRETEVKCPYKVFTDNDYDGHLVLPENITRLGDYTFYACISLTSIDLSNTRITSIGGHAFQYCSSLASVALPDHLTSIGEFAFLDCCLTSIDLPDTLTNIEKGAFESCGFTGIDLSHTQITNIANAAFADCFFLTSIDLPDTLLSIDTNAFSGCISLTNIDLPDTLTRIGGSVFGGCKSLTNINYAGTMEEWDAIDKANTWNYIALEKITCSDGVITPANND